MTYPIPLFQQVDLARARRSLSSYSAQLRGHHFLNKPAIWNEMMVSDSFFLRKLNHFWWNLIDEDISHESGNRFASSVAETNPIFTYEGRHFPRSILKPINLAKTARRLSARGSQADNHAQSSHPHHRRSHDHDRARHAHSAGARWGGDLWSLLDHHISHFCCNVFLPLQTQNEGRRSGPGTLMEQKFNYSILIRSISRSRCTQTWSSSGMRCARAPAPLMTCTRRGEAASGRLKL